MNRWTHPTLTRRVLATAAPATASSLGVVSYTATVKKDGESSKFDISVTFSSTYATSKSLSRQADLDVLPTGVTWTKAPDSPISVKSGTNKPIKEIAKVTGAAVGQSVTFVYTLSTGTSPATENVSITVVL